MPKPTRSKDFGLFLANQKLSVEGIAYELDHLKDVLIAGTADDVPHSSVKITYQLLTDLAQLFRSLPSSEAVREVSTDPHEHKSLSS